MILIICFNQITREFKRLSQLDLVNFNEGVNKYSNRLISIQPGKGKMPPVVLQCKELIQTSETESARKGKCKAVSTIWLKHAAL